MTYNTTVTDAFDDQVLEDNSTMGGRSTEPVSDGPALPRPLRKQPAPRRARAVADNGIKAFMLGFTASAAKTDTGDSHMNIAQATKDFLQAASFLKEEP